MKTPLTFVNAEKSECGVGESTINTVELAAAPGPVRMDLSGNLISVNDFGDVRSLALIGVFVYTRRHLARPERQDERNKETMGIPYLDICVQSRVL